MRRGLLQVALDALERPVVVDQGPLEVAGEQVAGDAQRQLCLLEHEGRRLRLLRVRLDLLPELHQELEVEPDVLRRGALGRRADDHAALLGGDLLDDVAQAVALVLLEPAGDAEALAVRDEDDEAAGERDLGRQPCSLRLHRILDRLDEHLLAAADQIGDPPAARPAALELGADDLVDEQEAVLLEADLDERRLHPRQDVVDDALVDVAGDRPAFGPLEIDLGDASVLEDGDALLGDVHRDEQLALRGRERRAPRHLATAVRRAPAAVGRRTCRRAEPSRPSPEPSRPSPEPVASAPVSPRLGGRPARGLAAIPAAATAATALGLRGLIARLGPGRDGRVARCGCFLLAERQLLGRQLGERRRDRRRRLLLLPAKPGQGQVKSPSRVRATATTRWSGRRCAAG